MTPIEFNNQLHAIKQHYGILADFDLAFGPTGDVWDPVSRDLCGHIVRGG